MWQNWKSQIVSKLNRSNYYKLKTQTVTTQKLRLWLNSKNQIVTYTKSQISTKKIKLVTKLGNSNCEKTKKKKWNCEKTEKYKLLLNSKLKILPTSKTLILKISKLTFWQINISNSVYTQKIKFGQNSISDNTENSKQRTTWHVKKQAAAPAAGADPPPLKLHQ